MVTLTREFMPTSFKATFESGFVIVSTHDSLQYSEERLQAIQLSILLPMSQCKVPVVCSKSCIERTMQRLDNALEMIENARQQVGVTKQQGAARCIELTEAVEVHLGVVANSKMANVAVIRSKFGFIYIYRVLERLLRSHRGIASQEYLSRRRCLLGFAGSSATPHIVLMALFQS